MSTAAPLFITGLGTVSAAGAGIDATWQGFSSSSPVSPPAPASIIETELRQPVFEVSLPENIFPTSVDFPSRTAELTALAAREALENAGKPHTEKNLTIGVCLGTTVACQLNSLEFYQQFRQTSKPDLLPVKQYLRGNLAEFIAELFSLHGPRSTLVNACASGTDAIGAAMNWVNSGLCDLAIAGGGDELNRIPLAGFNSLGIMSEAPCRPFDRHRDGLNLGEGTGVVIIESQASTRKRRRDPGLTLAGYGSGCDAHHMTAPHPQGVGLRLAVRTALEQAGLKPENIAFANAHGTATRDNDRVEGGVLADIFGSSLPVYSTKGRTGHTLGGAGGLEAVFTALSLREGWIPASTGFSEQDPEIPLTPVAEAVNHHGKAAISTSLAFGGGNSAIIITSA